MQLFSKDYWNWLSLNLVICFLLVYSVNGVYFIKPNAHMHAIGGDALAIYYDVAYHVCYGDSDIFTGMNYPEGELIFMTDAQGAIAMVLQWINRYLFSISDYTIGIINWLNAVSILLCSLFVHLILRELNVKQLNAAIFSPLITVMSPQIFRIPTHFGLAYIFIIPLFFYWVLKRSKDPRFYFLDIFVFILLIGLTFNNPYTGFICSSILIFSGFFMWIRNKFDFKNLYVGGMGILGILLPFLYFKLFDPVVDRIKIQWGFFEYKATILGYIAPKDSLSSDLLKFIGFSIKDVQFESQMYIGILSLFLLIFLLLTFIFKKNRFKYTVPISFYPLLVASFILFLYASGTFFLPFDQDTMEDKFSILLMFKAVGRLGWPLYFALTILSILFLDNILKQISYWANTIIIILSFLIWNWDINTYIKPKLNDHVYENYFDKTNLSAINKTLKEFNINKDSFQAILSLPKLMTWNDNFISNVNWNTQFYSMKISLATGLPMINAMLSRMSVGQTAERIELLANPVVYKSLIDKLPNQKDVLVVLGLDYQQLTSGEIFLLEVSDTLYHEPGGFILLRLPLSKINNNIYYGTAKQFIGDTIYENVDHFYNGFENEPLVKSYFGVGAKLCPKGTNEIFYDSIKNPLSDKYKFSIWTKLDYQKYGLGWFSIEVKNKAGDVIFKEVPDSRRSNEVNDEWIMTEMTFPVVTDCSVKINFDTNRDIYVDELLIRPDSSTIIIQDYNRNQILYNGFKIVN